MAAAKQDMSIMFDDLRDNNDKGAREYRVAEGLAPLILDGAPVDDTDLALYNGQLAIFGAVVYVATGVTATTTAWLTVTAA